MDDDQRVTTGRGRTRDLSLLESDGVRSRHQAFVVIRVAAAHAVLYATDSEWSPAREHARLFANISSAEAVATLLRTETGDATVTAQRLRLSWL